eukprot:s126_g43.t1
MCAQIEKKMRHRSLASEAVQKLLSESLKALVEAPNRALKRRVRQRLHKKLGCMLGQKDFEEAMNRFKLMEEGVAKANAPQTPLDQVPPSQFVQPLGISMPLLVPVLVPWTPGPLQVTQGASCRFGECPSSFEGRGECRDGASTTMEEDELQSLSDRSTEWKRTMSELSEALLPTPPLPVSNTFIQYQLPRSGSMRRDEQTRPHGKFFNLPTLERRDVPVTIGCFSVDSAGADGNCLRSERSVHGSWIKKSSGASSPTYSRVFLDTEEMKQRVKDALAKPSYTVFDFYYKTGLFQWIAKCQSFETATLIVIGFNALWLAHDTNSNNSSSLLDARIDFQIAEIFFCSYYALEWFIRFMAFERKCNCLRDGWFVFDIVSRENMAMRDAGNGYILACLRDCSFWR